MNILGIETTSSKGTVALYSGDKFVAELELEHPLRHSRYVIAAVDRLLVDACMDITDISRIAVGIGPGSFTGIRVGIAIAKGLNCDFAMKVVGIPSLKNIAVQLSGETNISAYISAQRDEFFVQKFLVCPDTGLVPDGDCMILTIDMMNTILSESTILVGPDYASIKPYSDKLLCRLYDHPVYPRGQYAAILAYQENYALSDDDIVPLYVRRSEAEKKGAKVYKF
ncbi:MAG: tRNA (adenosine(37)-N6)-threonylcarbamoyltransferase complex dimerization subunit type 1 TsaB [Candidatus Auribacterota bacterium]|jgi:tRNA threonylcarbamoyl adenosine modification protein YeaZ|nr:tRNA (adenosine(37)-N6)-threonylcarbamoyltransferase complex dimerization subunit type 1 TsaB [Candidatus Auribacterota bacterium]